MSRNAPISPLMQELSGYIAGTLKRQTMAAKGSPDNPLDRNEAAEKALDLMAPVIGSVRGKKLIETLYDITRVKDVRALRKLYSA